MDNKIKHFKYKNKYLSLKKQNGGSIAVNTSQDINRLREESEKLRSESYRLNDLSIRYRYTSDYVRQKESHPTQEEIKYEKEIIEYEKKMRNYYKRLALSTRNEADRLRDEADRLRNEADRLRNETVRLRDETDIFRVNYPPDVEREVDVITSDGYQRKIYLFKVGVEKQMFANQIAAYLLVPKDGSPLSTANEDTIYISNIPSLKGKTFKIKIEVGRKNTIYMITRLS